MWNMTELQRDIWEKKYQFEGETFDEWLDRVSDGDKDIKELIETQRFLFGGRILSNRGLYRYGKKVTYSNCYVLGTDDSIEDIYQTCSDVARTFSMGGGVGIDISKLRPIGSEVNNTAKTTSGACSFMPTFSQVAETIGQNGRRGALMISMDVNHPEVEEFINMKANSEQVTKANISIRVDDKFMKNVIEDKPHVTSFTLPTGKVVTKTFYAKELFRLLAKNNYDWAEPGMLYWDTINNWNILSEDEEFEYGGVNPCAEEPLPIGGSCLLGSFNLSAYVNKKGEFDFHQFRKDIPVVVKGMNDVLDEGLPLHPLQVQKDTVRDYRQIGIGVMGIADMLIKMGITYGSKESIDLCDMIGYILADESMKASSLLAKEFGAYPKCKIDKVLQSPYVIYNASLETRELIEKYGLRNSQLLTIAPTGTLSTMLGISGGIEPIFANFYTRKTESLHGKDVYYKVYTPIVEKYMTEHGLLDEEELPEFFVTAQTLNPFKRIDMQSVWQSHIDASISSTLNLPNDTTISEVEELYEYGWDKKLKGMTIFRDGCKRVGILTLDEDNEEEDNGELKRGEWAPIPDDTIYLKRKVYTGCGKLNLFIGYSPSEDRLVEVYTKRSGNGGCEHNIDSTVICMSGMLRLGGTLDNVKKAFEGCGACNSFTRAKCGGKKLSPGKSCATAILNMIEKTIKEIRESGIVNIVSKEEEVIEDKIDLMKELDAQALLDKGLCPDCGEPLDKIGGCVQCSKCGFSKCG